MPRRRTRRCAGGGPSPRANPALRWRQCAPHTVRTHVCPVRQAQMRRRQILRGTAAQTRCTGAHGHE
eukprot:1031649-Alexandrium_andersonii.AAC.1